MTSLHDAIQDSVSAQEDALATIERPELRARARKQRTVAHVLATALAAVGVSVVVVVGFAATTLLAARSEVTSADPIQMAPAAAPGAFQDTIWLTRGALEPGIADSSVVVDVYLDPMCPYCGDFGTTVEPELVAMEGVVVVYHPVAFMDASSSDGSYSTRAGSAIQEVAANAPDRIREFLALLWANQPADGSTLTDEQLAQLGTEAGVPTDVTTLFEQHRYADAVAASAAATADAGIVGVPYVLIDGTVFKPDAGEGWEGTIPAVEQARADRGL